MKLRRNQVYCGIGYIPTPVDGKEKRTIGTKWAVTLFTSKCVKFRIEDMMIICNGKYMSFPPDKTRPEAWSELGLLKYQCYSKELCAW